MNCRQQDCGLGHQFDIHPYVSNLITKCHHDIGQSDTSRSNIVVQIVKSGYCCRVFLFYMNTIIKNRLHTSRFHYIGQLICLVSPLLARREFKVILLCRHYTCLYSTVCLSSCITNETLRQYCLEHNCRCSFLNDDPPVGID